MKIAYTNNGKTKIAIIQEVEKEDTASMTVHCQWEHHEEPRKTFINTLKKEKCKVIEE